MIELSKYDMDRMVGTVYYHILGDDEQILIHDKRCTIMGANVVVPIKAWSNPPHTIVQFDDGSKVVVKCEDGKPYDFFAGFCIAIEKKRFGSATALNKAFEYCQKRADCRKHEREAKQAFSKRMKEKSRKYAKELRESKIRKRMEELRIEREAQRRMDEKEKEDNNG